MDATDKDQQILTLDPIKCAEFLIVGFVKLWRLRMVMHLAGIPQDTKPHVLHAAIPFFPAEARHYESAQSVRSYMTTEWPKLAAYLTANAGNPEKLLAAAPQLARLACKSKRGSFLSKEDMEEGRRARTELRVTDASNRAARAQQLSTQRGAWNVVKGVRSRK